MPVNLKEMYNEALAEAEAMGLDDEVCRHYATDFVAGYIDYQVDRLKYECLDGYPKPVKVPG